MRVLNKSREFLKPYRKVKLTKEEFLDDERVLKISEAYKKHEDLDAPNNATFGEFSKVHAKHINQSGTYTIY